MVSGQHQIKDLSSRSPATYLTYLPEFRPSNAPKPITLIFPIRIHETAKKHISVVARALWDGHDGYKGKIGYYKEVDLMFGG